MNLSNEKRYYGIRNYYKQKSNQIMLKDFPINSKFFNPINNTNYKINMPIYKNSNSIKNLNKSEINLSYSPLRNTKKYNFNDKINEEKYKRIAVIQKKNENINISKNKSFDLFGKKRIIEEERKECLSSRNEPKKKLRYSRLSINNRKEENKNEKENYISNRDSNCEINILLKKLLDIEKQLKDEKKKIMN